MKLRALCSSTALVVAAALGGVTLSGTAAHASDGQFLLTVDGALSIPVSDPFDDLYNPGIYGGLGAYWTPSGVLALGARLHTGVLMGDDDHGTDKLGFGLLTVTLRVRPMGGSGASRASGLWLEAGVGAGMMDDLGGDGVDVQPAFEAGIGYQFEVGPIGIGPYVGLAYILRAEDEATGLGGEDLATLQVGVELNFFDSREHAEPVAEAPPAVIVTTPPAEPVRRRPSGMEGDSLTIDEEVFFDYNKAELRDAGKARLDEIVQYWEDDGDGWAALTVSGHADERGPADYNIELSQQRADAVAAYLVSRGIPRSLIDTVAYGESRPAIPDATTPEEYQANRRVEFTIQRKK